MQMSRRSFLSAVLLSGPSVALAGCGGPASVTAGTDTSQADATQDGKTVGSASAPVTRATIVSPDASFDVTTVHVPVGQPIEFTYDNRHEGVPHNLHVSGDGLDSKTPVRPGEIVQTLTVTFPRAGRYDYICDVHPDTMQGVVIAG
jgi:plastocyanin